MAIPEQFCRLCLHTISDGFEKLDMVKVEMLEKMSLNLDLALTDKPLVCFKCRNALQQSYDFKMMCLKNGNYVETTDLSSLKPYHENGNVAQIVVKHEKESMCRLCLKYLDSDSFVKFEVGEDTFLQDMLHKCFPEMEPSNIYRSLICHDCMRNCQKMITFVADCSNNEGKVKKYIQTNGATSNGPINLSDALKFIHDIKDYEKIIGTSIDFMKYESLLDDLNTSCGTAMIKTELFEETGGPDNFTGPLESTSCDSIVKMEEIEQLEEDEIYIKNEEDISLATEITTDLNCSQGSNERNSSVTMQRCTQCNYQTKYKYNLKRHLLCHEDSSKVTMYKCTECKFESKYKEYLRIHLLTHKDKSDIAMYKCEKCSFESKHKTSLRRHVLSHKDASEIPMHKCTECNYQTKHKNNLHKHMYVHTGAARFTTHKCAECSYATVRKEYLRKHMLVHKDISEIVHKCSECNYEAVSKSCLRQHMLVHEEASEIDTHECTQCLLYKCCSKVKHVRNLPKHMLTHKDSSEHKLCRYHMLTQKNDSDVTIYRCAECSYASKHRQNFQQHLLVHKDASEVTMHKCTRCGFETKHKASLQKHMLIHRDASEITMHKCAVCDFQTIHKGYLHRHMLIHKRASEINMHKCTECSYQGACKDYLHKHMLLHKDPSEVTMHKCTECNYQTFRKHHLRKHLLTHQDSSNKRTMNSK